MARCHLESSPTSSSVRLSTETRSLGAGVYRSGVESVLYISPLFFARKSVDFTPPKPTCPPVPRGRNTPGARPPTCLLLPAAYPIRLHPTCSHTMLQASNSYLYRANLRKRVKAGSPNALRARRKELEREVKKSEKRT